MSIINYAIIGFGGMARYHKDRLMGVYGYSLAGIYDIDSQVTKKAWEDNVKIYSDAGQISRDKTVNMVLIATPNDSHKQYCIDMCNAKKHVLCEKPATMTIKDFDEMTRAASDNEVLLTVHQNRRWDKDYLTAMAIIDSGIIGKVYKLTNSVCGGNGIPLGWRTIKKHGGGMVLDWGVHLIDQLVYYKKLKPEIVNYSLSYQQGYEVDDGFEINLKWQDGFDAKIIVDTNTFVQIPRWVLYGSEGSAIIRDWDCNGEVVVSKGIDLKLKGINAGNGFTKTMAKRSNESQMHLELPKVQFDGDEFYKNWRDSIIGKTTQIVKNEEVRQVLTIMQSVLE